MIDRNWYEQKKIKFDSLALLYLSFGNIWGFGFVSHLSWSSENVGNIAIRGNSTMSSHIKDCELKSSDFKLKYLFVGTLTFKCSVLIYAQYLLTEWRGILYKKRLWTTKYLVSPRKLPRTYNLTSSANNPRQMTSQPPAAKQYVILPWPTAVNTSTFIPHTQQLKESS